MLGFDGRKFYTDKEDDFEREPSNAEIMLTALKEGIYFEDGTFENDLSIRIDGLYNESTEEYVIELGDFWIADLKDRVKWFEDDHDMKKLIEDELISKKGRIIYNDALRKFEYLEDIE